MDKRVREFIRQVARTVVGLDVALYYQTNPNTCDTAAGLALRLCREVEQVVPVLERLVDHSILQRTKRQHEQYESYSLVRKPKVWNLLCLLSESYLDNAQTCKEIARMLVRQQTEARARRHSSKPPQ